MRKPTFFDMPKQRRRSVPSFSLFNYIEHTSGRFSFHFSEFFAKMYCGCTAKLCQTWSETPKLGFLATVAQIEERALS